MANRPVHELKVGRVRGAIWENRTEGGPRYSVGFSRLYKDNDGNWKDSEYFSRDDLPLLIKVADQAHSWLYGPEAQGSLEPEQSDK